MNHVTKCAEALREKFHIRTNPEYPGQVSYAATTEEIEAVLKPFFPKQPEPQPLVDYKNMKEPKTSIIEWIKWYRFNHPKCTLEEAHRLAKRKKSFK